MNTLTLTRPDDWHLHLRDGTFLRHTVPASAQHFARALIMPNLDPPLISVTDVLAYRQRILANIPTGFSFHPYMTLYLNASTSANELTLAASDSDILGAKLYPAGATTHSQAGVRDVTALYPLFDIMQANDLVLQIHGEVTHGDIFEREALFITDHLQPLIKNFPKLRIVLEHISTQTAVDFVRQASSYVAATITPQHLMYNRNQLLVGGIKPHYYCLPILKQQHDQIALQKIVSQGHPRFFAGTDSAPHSRTQKENACGCAGVFSAPYAIAAYTQIFDDLDALPQLNNFLSRFGAEFYHLPLNTETITLIKKPQTIVTSLPFGQEEVVPMAAGSTLHWSIYG